MLLWAAPTVRWTEACVGACVIWQLDFMAFVVAVNMRFTRTATVEENDNFSSGHERVRWQKNVVIRPKL